jgi:hypothetical protein
MFCLTKNRSQTGRIPFSPQGALMNNTARKVVEAEEFRLVDSIGRLRALMVSSPSWDGEPSITLFDQQGHGRLTLELHDGAPRITLFAPSGQPVVGLGTHEEGGTAFAMNREDGTLGLYVRVAPATDAIIQAFDKDGKKGV